MDTQFLKSIKNAIRYWYIPLLAGLFFVMVSAVVFVSPLPSFGALAILFSLSFLFSGISEIIFSITNRDQLINWGWSLALGIITAIMGVLLLTNTALSMVVLAFFVGFVVLFRSIAAISFAIDIKSYGSKNWGGLLALGIFGTLTSFILLWNPVLTGISISFWVALSFLFAGFISIYFSFQLRKLHKSSKKLSSEIKEEFKEFREEIKEELFD